MSDVVSFEPVLDAGAVAEGALVSVEVAGAPVCVTRVDGELHAFDDRCPHRGTPLSQGRLRGTTLTCAAHTWEFDVTTGKLLRLRAPDCLAMRSVREHEGRIEVSA